MDLNDLWNVHFHDPGDEDWTMKSYHLLHTLSTVEDFWIVNNAIKDKLQNGMFFVMREHIFPCWDDPENKDGGCISIKVPRAKVLGFWEALCAAVLGETLISNMEQMAVINGISISPKRAFCIIKIWIARKDVVTMSNLKLPLGYIGDVMFRSWVQKV